MTALQLVAQALDPRRSVVVEACAGSGKTWLLVSRILRLLLEGAAPGEILAITYTRKAAREIEGRLAQWLELLALGGEEEVLAFLRERQVPEERLEAALPRARALFEQVQAAAPALTVSTFHGWFARLAQGAPLASDLAGFVLHESGARLTEEVWQLFAEDCGRSGAAAAQSLLWLLENVGPEGTRALLFRLAERRAEWHAWAGEDAARALGRLREELGVGEEPAAVARFSSDESIAAELREYAALLGRSDLARDTEAVEALGAAARLTEPEARFAAVCGVFLTKEGTLRKREANKASGKRFGAAAGRLFELHARLGAAVQAAEAARQEEQAWTFNRHALTAGAAFLEALERYKRERRLMDFADLEWHVARMLDDGAQAAFLQARLDARYKHILLDEFQDTNPLQWRILLGWLAAYGADGDKPRLFVVGDPKQSIYRFRRAEPRVFEQAGRFLAEHYGAVRIAHDTTRRNAPRIIEVVNRLFSGEERFQPFRPHAAVNAGLPGRVEVLPLCAGEKAQGPGPGGGLRDPLAEPALAEEDRRRRAEAQLLVDRIREIVGHWAVAEGDAERPARYGDIMVLTRRRSVLPEFERALRAARIPYLSVGRGGLLRTLEAQDLGALLRCLATPADDLALAHALRTPLFGASDEDLLRLAGRAEAHWWQRLQACALEASAPPVLARAAALLADWRARAGQLPVHDLLDRIYHEGDLVARYRVAVPAAMWPGVAANLEAFIALALQLDAGRYPSLPRFLDELVRLGQAAEEEAPDEGAIRVGEAEDRVRILTVHGAKGLEAPVVWLVDAHNASPPREAWSVLLDWPPDEPRPCHLSLVGRKGERGHRRQDLLEAEATYAAREELNLLYVALTRARQFFFASGVEAKREGASRSAWQRLAAAVADLGGTDGVWGEGPHRAVAASAASPPEPRQPVVPSAPAVGVRRPAAAAGALHGARLHLALEWLAGGGDGERPPPGMGAAEWPAYRQAAQAVLQAPGLRRFFDRACYRRALNEVEFALADGRVGRIDRLVETEEALWVLDYKSGAPDPAALEEYGRQLEAYRAAVAAVFPAKAVRCALVFPDGTLRELSLFRGAAID